MIFKEQCNDCVHEPICSFKNTYQAACNAISSLEFNVNRGAGEQCNDIIKLKDSGIDVSAKCPYIIKKSQIIQTRLDISP